MSSVLFIMFVAVANLAFGAGVAIVTGAAPPLRELVDGIIYERYDDDGQQDGDGDTDAAKDASDKPGESDSAG